MAKKKEVKNDLQSREIIINLSSWTDKNGEKCGNMNTEYNGSFSSYEIIGIAELLKVNGLRKYER